MSSMRQQEAQPNMWAMLEDYFEIFLRRKWWIVIFLVLGLAGAEAALYIIIPVYRSTTVILVEPQKIPENYIKSTITVDMKDRLNTISQQVMSRTRLEVIINEFGLYPQMRNRATMDAIVQFMRTQIFVNVKGRDSFSITYNNTNPETAMNITNKLSSLFIEENLKVREQQAEGTTQFLDAQLKEFKISLETQEARLRDFKQLHMGELPSQLQTNLRTLDRLQLDLQATNESIRLSEDRLATLQVSPESNPIRGRLDTMRMELYRLESEYTNKYPEVIRLRKEIDEAEKQIMLEQKAIESREQSRISVLMATQIRDLKAEIESLKQKKKGLTRQIDLLQGRVDRTPIREEQLAALSRDYENTKKSYDSLLEKKLEAQMSESLEKRQKGEQFRIIDPANLPDTPFKPNPTIVLLAGIAAGIGSGIGLAILLEYLDSSFRKVEDLYITTNLPVLVAIPTIQGLKTK